MQQERGIMIMSVGNVEKADAVENFADNPTVAS